MEAVKTMDQADKAQEDESMTDGGGASDDDPESEEGVNSNDDGLSLLYRDIQKEEYRHDKLMAQKAKALDVASSSRTEGSPWTSISRSWHGEEDGDFDVDVNFYIDDGRIAGSSKIVHGPARRVHPAGLADLDSSSGR
jgi:hypothetical protein